MTNKIEKEMNYNEVLGLLIANNVEGVCYERGTAYLYNNIDRWLEDEGMYNSEYATTEMKAKEEVSSLLCNLASKFIAVDFELIEAGAVAPQRYVEFRGMTTKQTAKALCFLWHDEKGNVADVWIPKSLLIEELGEYKMKEEDFNEFLLSKGLPQ